MHNKYLLAILTFMLGMLAGIYFQKKIGVWQIKKVFFDVAPLSWSREHKPLRSIPKKGLMVALAFGQSNSANFGQGRQTAPSGVYNFYQNELYLAQDPMLGADGNGASTWPRLGNLLIRSERYDHVIFATIGVGGSSISRWKPGGDLHPNLLATLQALKQNQLEITHLFWHQGESDALLHTSTAEYQQSFKEMLQAIRQQKVTAPIYVSLATRHRSKPQNNAIRQAQLTLTQQDKTILSGPDSDQLGNNYRRDGTHFNNKGLDRLAQLWFEKIIRNIPDK